MEIPCVLQELLGCLLNVPVSLAFDSKDELV